MLAIQIAKEIQNTSLTFVSGVLSTLTVGALGLWWSRTVWGSGYRKATMNLNNATDLLRADQFEQSRAEVEKCLAFLEEQQRYSLLSKAYLILGDCASGGKDWARALGHYVLAVSNAKMAHAENLESILAKVGKAYMDAGRTDDAISYFNQAIDIGSRERDRAVIVLAEAHRNRGKIEALRGNIDRAISDYYEAVEYEKAVPDFARTLAATHAELGDVFLRRERNEEARAEFKSAVDLYSEAGDSPVVEMLLEKMKDIPEAAAAGR